MDLNEYTERLNEEIYRIFKEYCICRNCGEHIQGKMRYYPMKVANGFHICFTEPKREHSMEYAVNEWMRFYLLHDDNRVDVARVLYQLVHPNDISIFLKIAFLFRWKLFQRNMDLLKCTIPTLIELAKACTNVPDHIFITILRNSVINCRDLYVNTTHNAIVDNTCSKIIAEHNARSYKLWDTWFMESDEYTHLSQWLPRELIEDMAMLMGHGTSPPI